MESSAVSEIMSQLQLLMDGMVLIRQDLDVLKRVNSIQHNTSEEVVDIGRMRMKRQISLPRFLTSYFVTNT